MYLVDEEKLIIHDMSSPKYECEIKKIAEDKRRKVYTLDQVKRMIDTQHRPQYNGCRWCMPEYHTFDMQSIFKHD
ncbi:MAG: hypothetical protein H6506_01165 [Calditrichaeota bacterium]|nr:hypothetical protein [Calditrichota bacterium]MCB9366501.1 hypothetical protein [Calditrichota bacterium]MCB9391241.1 hypothetical protein [Calditrichota bacterium]